MGNTKIRPCCIDRAIISEVSASRYSRKARTFQINKCFIIRHFFKNATKHCSSENSLFCTADLGHCWTINRSSRPDRSRTNQNAWSINNARLVIRLSLFKSFVGVGQIMTWITDDALIDADRDKETIRWCINSGRKWGGGGELVRRTLRESSSGMVSHILPIRSS